MTLERKQREDAGLVVSRTQPDSRVFVRAALQGTVCGACGRTQSGFTDHSVRRVHDLHEPPKNLIGYPVSALDNGITAP
jgi:hypothetical protein